MVRHGWTTRDVSFHVNELQTFLNSSAIGQPLEWEEGPIPDPQVGWGCYLQRCIGVTSNSGTIYPNSTCNQDCPELASNEWLANDAYWSLDSSSQFIVSIQNTKLKKSLANSQSIPPWELLEVPMDARCNLVTIAKVDGYWICSV